MQDAVIKILSVIMLLREESFHPST